MRSIKMLFALLLLFSVTGVFAQKTVTGKVTDASTGTPVEGVTVRVKGSSSLTSTDRNGVFSIQASLNDVLILSFVGYAEQQVNVNGQSNISVKLIATITDLGQVVLVGTRRAGRIKTETPVPVDVVNISQAALPTGRMDLTSILNYAAPSFNYNKQSGSDGADHIDLATLRGLGPDQTLVLVNGKRRHQTAFVAVFGTRGRGNSGTDLSAIPVSAIDRVEILRDGAAAQYGSDAIAGVINIILKKDVNHFSANIGYSGYYDKKFNTWYSADKSQYPRQGPIDGNAATVGMDYGFKLGANGGFVNIAGNFTGTQKTFRQIIKTDNFLTDRDALYPNYVRRANGDGSLMAGGAMINMEVPLNETGRSTFYAFGGYNYKKSDAYAFTRTYSARPNRFPTDEDGQLIYVPEIMATLSDGDIVYNPHIQTQVQDGSLAGGCKRQKPW